MDALSQHNLKLKESQWIEGKTPPLDVEQTTLFPSDFFDQASVEIRDEKIGKMVELVRALGLDVCETLERVKRCLGYDGTPAFAVEVARLDYQDRSRYVVFIGELHASTPTGSELEVLKPLWQHLPVRLIEGYHSEKLIFGSHFAALSRQWQAEFREQYGLNSSSAITASSLDAAYGTPHDTSQSHRITQVLGDISRQLEGYLEKLKSGELSKESASIVVVKPDGSSSLTPDDVKVIENLLGTAQKKQYDPSAKSLPESRPAQFEKRVVPLESGHVPSILEHLNSINVVTGEYFSSGITSTPATIALLATLASSAVCLGTGWLFDSVSLLRTEVDPIPCTKFPCG